VHIRSQTRKKGIKGEALGYFKGGFSVLVEALVASLKSRGVKIYTQTGLDALVSLKDGVDVTYAGRAEKFDAVLATIPSHYLQPLIQGRADGSGEYFEQLNSVSYLGAVCAIFASKQKISSYYWHSICDAEAPFVVFINHTSLMRPEDYQGLYVYYIGKYVPHDHPYFSQTEDEIYKLWFNYLKTIFPDFDENLVTEKHLFKFKYAQHIAEVGYLKKVANYRTPFKAIYLSNFSQIFPEERSTSFAIREGNKVAEMIDRDLSGSKER
jgi:protoporphyrinogen oxidase